MGESTIGMGIWGHWVDTDREGAPESASEYHKSPLGGLTARPREDDDGETWGGILSDNWANADGSEAAWAELKVFRL